MILDWRNIFENVLAGVILATIIAICVLVKRKTIAMLAARAAHKINEHLNYVTIGKWRIGDGAVVKGVKGDEE